MNMHRFSSLLAELDQEPPTSPTGFPSSGMTVISASSLPCLSKDQIEAAQSLHKLAFEQAMQSLAPPPSARGLFDSMN